MQGVLDVNLGVLAGRPRGYIYQDLMYIKIHLSWTLHHDTNTIHVLRDRVSRAGVVTWSCMCVCASVRLCVGSAVRLVCVAWG